MKMKIKLILIALLSISVISCENENDLNVPEPEQENLLLHLDAKKIANEHNRLLSEIYDIQSKNSKVSLKGAVSSLNLDIIENDKQEIYDWSISKNVEDHDAIITNAINTDVAKKYYNEIDKAITEDYSNPIKLEKSISKLLMQVEEEVLNPTDVQILRIFGETSKASAKFWYGKNKGKNRALKRLNNKYEVAKEKEEVPSWVKADGKGAASASITWAVGAALASGPVAPATYFVGVGLGAALASIMN